MYRRALLVALAAAALAGSPARAAPPKAPVVLAAASLQESLTAAADAFARQGHPKPVLSFAGSSALARQIEQGAPADLFISADEDWMNYLAERNLIQPASRTAFLGNRLVLIAPASKPFTLSIKPGFPLASRLGRGRLSMADVNAVPAGKYGRTALTTLGVWPSVQDRVVQSDNVRAALTFVERGEAAAGIVYATDAKASGEVVVVGTFPANSHPPIRYPLALIKRSREPEAAAFRRFLLSSAGKAIFARYGFSTK